VVRPRWRPSRLAPLLALGLLATRGSTAAAGPACKVDGVPRIVAVGDVHGAYERFVAILRAAGILDERERWSGGRAHLVQLGDALDRGSEGPRVLDLLMRLERQARSAGGRVHALLGNHEVMNIMGDLRYVSPEEYQTFRTLQSETLRHHAYERALERAQQAAKAKGEKLDEVAFRAKFMEQVPLGLVERSQAFSESGRYGSWLRGHDTEVVLNGVVFVHGGLTAEVAAMGCEKVNSQVRREIGSDLGATLASPQASLAAGENGPLWYRGLTRGSEQELAPLVDQVLGAAGARAVVIGHTVTGTGHIVTRAGGRVVMIDTGMSDGYGAHASALEVDGEGRMAAVYPDGREPLGLPAAARLAPRPAFFLAARLAAP
jgi:hypothetical protein